MRNFNLLDLEHQKCFALRSIAYFEIQWCNFNVHHSNLFWLLEISVCKNFVYVDCLTFLKLFKLWFRISIWVTKHKAIYKLFLKIALKSEYLLLHVIHAKWWNPHFKFACKPFRLMWTLWALVRLNKHVKGFELKKRKWLNLRFLDFWIRFNFFLRYFIENFWIYCIRVSSCIT